MNAVDIRPPKTSRAEKVEFTIALALGLLMLWSMVT
jgi:hypothetical protein